MGKRGFIALVSLTIALAVILNPALSALTISPSAVTVPAPNRSVEFEITYSPDKPNKIVNLAAAWPSEGTLSWTNRTITVGAKVSTKLTLKPGSPGKHILRISVSGEGVLPEEEYAEVTVENPADYSALGSEISSYRSREDSLLSKAKPIGGEAYSQALDLNASLSLSEGYYSEGRYSQADSSLSIMRQDLPPLEAKVAELRKDKGFILTDISSFLPAWTDSVSFDLAILIVVLLAMVGWAAKAFLF